MLENLDSFLELPAEPVREIAESAQRSDEMQEVAEEAPAPKPPPKKKRTTRKKVSEPEPDITSEPEQESEAPTEHNPTSELTEPEPKLNPASESRPARKKNIHDLDLNELDRYLTDDERKEWSSVYASYRAKSLLSGTVVGMDENRLDVRNPNTQKFETITLNSLIIISHRVKILIPETEMWMPGSERPPHVMRGMVGSTLDYVIMEVDREGGCAVGSRKMAMSAKRYFFSREREQLYEGQRMKCRVLVTGAKRSTVECHGYDIPLSQRDLSYSAIADLREKYRPGQELDCIFKAYDEENDRLIISVKEATSNPFDGAEIRHPIGSRRQATISGKYAGGVFCTLPDETVCLCLYSTLHSDIDFNIGDSAIVLIRQYDHGRRLIYGRILSKW